jgi:hypothetical protein
MISLPDDLLKKAEELASFERLSVEEFLSARLTEQFAGLEYLRARAERASDEKFRAALRQIRMFPRFLTTLRERNGRLCRVI